MNESEVKKAVEDYMRSATTAQASAFAAWISEQEWANKWNKGPDIGKLQRAIRDIESAVNEIESEL